MRQTDAPRQPEELSKLRRLADLLDQAAVAIESYLSLGEGPQDTLPLDMDSLNSASAYLTMSGLGPDAQQLLKRGRLFMEHLTVITAINGHRNGCIPSVQGFYRAAGFTDELPNLDTPEQREEELGIRWGLLRDIALDLQPLLRDLHAHVVRELSEDRVHSAHQDLRPEPIGQNRDRPSSEAKEDGRLSSNAVATNTPASSVMEALPPWTPPPGYIGRKTICNDLRFRKGGKNPPLTTIDVWVKAAEREGKPVKIEKAPDSGENHYPEAWIVERIRTWNPRANKRNPPT